MNASSVVSAAADTVKTAAAIKAAWKAHVDQHAQAVGWAVLLLAPLVLGAAVAFGAVEPAAGLVLFGTWLGLGWMVGRLVRAAVYHACVVGAAVRTTLAVVVIGLLVMSARDMNLHTWAWLMTASVSFLLLEAAARSVESLREYTVTHRQEVVTVTREELEAPKQPLPGEPATAAAAATDADDADAAADAAAAKMFINARRLQREKLAEQEQEKALRGGLGARAGKTAKL